MSIGSSKLHRGRVTVWLYVDDDPYADTSYMDDETLDEYTRLSRANLAGHCMVSARVFVDDRMLGQDGIGGVEYWAQDRNTELNSDAYVRHLMRECAGNAIAEARQFITSLQSA